MKLNKDEFLKTEFGEQFKYTVGSLHDLYEKRAACANLEDWEEVQSCCYRINELRTGLGVFMLALKEFYGIEYRVRETAHYYGVCTKDGSDWLFKVERKIDGKGVKS